jgi:hypothetical protein
MTINNYLKKERIFFVPLLFALFSLVSCEKQPVVTFGPTYIADNNGANLVVVDTSTVNMSTVFVDSTATAATGFLQVGNLNDPYFGNVNSRGFLQVAPPSSLPTLTSFDGYDSIALIMIFKKSNPFYGDTTIPQTFVVNQVDTLYQLGAFQRGFFSNSSFPLDPTPLGSATAIIAPNLPYTSQGFGDSLKIKMNDNLGLTLFNMVYNRSDTIRFITNWLAWFHGLCVSPGAGSQGAIYGFRDSAIMRVYYREAGVVTTEKFLDFQLTQKSFQFNNVVANWTGTALNNIIKPVANPQPPPATPSSSTANAAYIGSMEGLSVKLTFPFLNNIAQRPDYLSVLRAQLTIWPVPNSFSNTWRLPPQITAYTTDVSNLLLSTVTGAGGVQNGNLNLNYFQPLNTTYNYDLTTFVKSQIINTGVVAGQNGIILSVPPPASTGSFTRAVLADKTYPQNLRITLSVYYISLYPHQ